MAKMKDDRSASSKARVSWKGNLTFGLVSFPVVRSAAGLLHMAMLNYNEEIRSPKQMVPKLIKPLNIQRQVQLAQALIRNWSQREFDFAAYDDQYRHKLKDLIKAKVADREIVAPKEEEPIEIVNLMDVLKKSVAPSHTPIRTRFAYFSNRRRRNGGNLFACSIGPRHL